MLILVKSFPDITEKAHPVWLSYTEGNLVLLQGEMLDQLSWPEKICRNHCLDTAGPDYSRKTSFGRCRLFSRSQTGF